MRSEAEQDLEVYLVGGAVRDALLGRPVGDRDWVVVGSTPEQMQTLGFTPVGKDFPVFLHPQTHAEYALARTERKRGQGHRGFAVHASPDVTLEEDLQRRDLTVNAIAQDDNGNFIDPFEGRRHLDEKLLRHVSPAFSEDPLRVFRVARFAAMLPDFSVDGDTLALMQAMAAAGELRTLSAERVWQELDKALAAQAPARFFAVLADCNCLGDWFPELAAASVQCLSTEPLLRFAELPLDAAGFKAMATRLKAPNLYLQTALDWVTWREALAQWRSVDVATLNEALRLLQVTHEPSRLQRMIALLQAHGKADGAALLDLAAGWQRVKISDETLSGPAYGQALAQARERFLQTSRS